MNNCRGHNLNLARINKNDEFYTLYSDIEDELQHYLHLLKGKNVYLPADTMESQFVKYFQNSDRMYKYNINFINTANDFRDNSHLFEWADVVVTNPPFSLWKQMLKMITDNDCKFLLVGTLNKLSIIHVYEML